MLVKRKYWCPRENPLQDTNICVGVCMSIKQVLYAKVFVYDQGIPSPRYQ